jgi:hypothetical protein
MATRKQIEANRLNAQKSTGPRTPEGKAVSRLNALTTGIDAKWDAFTGEDKFALQDLAAEYDREYQPLGTAERVLVDQLVKSDWFLRRYRNIAANLIDWGMQQAFFKKEGAELGDTFATHLEAHRRIHRHLIDEDRLYHRSLAILEARQAARRAAAEALEARHPSASPAVTATEQTPNPEIGFVPQNTSDSPHAAATALPDVPADPDAVSQAPGPLACTDTVLANGCKLMADRCHPQNYISSPLRS